MFKYFKKLIDYYSISLILKSNTDRSRNKYALFIIVCVYVVSFTAMAGAKELYVDIESGNDSVSYAANSASNPWQTIGRAAWGSPHRDSPDNGEAAQAGDTVIVQEGIYSDSGSGGRRYEPFYNPVNSGTSNNTITFEARGNVELRYIGTDGRPILGSLNKDYIIWDGFILDENHIDVHRDTGPVVIWDSMHVTVQNLRITGINQGWGDNHNAIRIEGAQHATVRNCYISGFTEDHGSAVTTYASSNVILEHNEVTNCQHGLFAKGSNPGPFIMRYNYIHGSVLKGIRLSTVDTGGAEVYQNVLHDVGEGIEMSSLTAVGPRNIKIVNNTIVSTDHTFRGSIYLTDNSLGGVSGIVIRNNIIVNSDNSALHVGFQDNVRSLTSDNNCFYNNGADARVGESTISLSTWQSTYNQDRNSFASNPSFVDYNNNNYKLNNGSICEGAGIDILDLDQDGSNTDPINIGAYVSEDDTIGITSNLENPSGDTVVSVPNTPTNLRMVVN
jgi:Right handed beta helix region